MALNAMLVEQCLMLAQPDIKKPPQMKLLEPLAKGLEIAANQNELYRKNGNK